MNIIYSSCYPPAHPGFVSDLCGNAAIYFRAPTVFMYSVGSLRKGKKLKLSFTLSSQLFFASLWTRDYPKRKQLAKAGRRSR